MRALIWIAEDTWEACVDQARNVLRESDQVTLLHVAPSDVEAVAAGAIAGRLGRHPPPHRPPLRAISDEEASALLAAARARLGREAALESRRGSPEREVVRAAAEHDLLVLARGGERRLGPKSFGHEARFVVDHAPCQVLVVWAGPPPGLDTLKLPPHLRR